jgi:uncharacterized damage-inducible protein DinB
VPTADPTLDRLIRHMAWANAALFARLATCSDEDLALAAPRNEWSVARILAHLVSAAGRYAARLEHLPRVDEAQPPTTVGELAALAALCAGYDVRLRAQAAVPDGPASFAEPDADVWPRSTVLAQAIHHATEHRAQIAGALATNGVDLIDLDAIDVWAFTEAETGGT